MRKILLVLSVILILGTITGCADYAKDYDKNTLIIKGNGKIIEVAVEDFSDSDVSEEDLSVYVMEQVDEYNSQFEKEMIKTQDLLTEDMSNVKLVMQYNNIDNYNEFNMQESVLADFVEMDETDLKGSFASPDGKTVKYSKMENTKKAKVIILSEKTNVVVPGDVLYYNKEVSVKKGVASTTGKGKAIIIFK